MTAAKLKACSVPLIPYYPPGRPDFISDREWHYFLMGFDRGLKEGSVAGTKLATEMLLYVENPAPIIINCNRCAEGGHDDK